MEIFEVGDLVYYQKNSDLPDIITPQFGPGPLKIVMVKFVSVDRIHYNPRDLGGGVAHFQHVYIEGYEHPISGAWFTHVPLDSQ